ncbi:MAG: hypothetical protein PHF10_02945 [Patescibacteria group bacterium]|nr:hypothetical protein [Patescibacteria group bacterium]MDD5534687.1 hypothetical protein [Patescibacteria group bacterium]
MNTFKKQYTQAWIIDVSMGYGHQRTANPLKHLAPDGQVISANNYPGIPNSDKNVWEASRKFYEFISGFKRVPLIGDLCFFIFDQFQKIADFYPRRNLSQPNLFLKQTLGTIKKGWGKHLIEKLKQNPIPIITTFFVPAYMAEFYDYPGDIYCVVCDADIARAWAPFNPRRSKIKYFAPTSRVASRLQLYGVRKENIFLTGYPLPNENIGSEKMEILKSDLCQRIDNLDPKGLYHQRYETLISQYLDNCPEKSEHPLTLMFAVGGAGAQKEIAINVVKSLKEKINREEIKIILVAGIKNWVKNFFIGELKNLDFENDPARSGIEIIYAKNMKEYFEKFNAALRVTDILWTKPSELSFYSGLGLPIIIAPSVGSQENFNRDWLIQHHAAIIQNDPKYTNEWLFDFLKTGSLADAAMHGFVEARNLGVFNIEKVLNGEEMK